MTLSVGVGNSTHRNPEQAGKEAVERAFKEAGVTACDFVMMFATVGYDQQAIVSAVRKATDKAPLAGCSGEGVIAQKIGNESSHGVTVMVWKSDDLRFRTVSSRGLTEDASKVGDDVAQKLGDIPEDALALFVLADGLTFNFDRFNRAFMKVAKVKKPLQMAGGTAGDSATQTKTFQYHDDEVFSDGVSCALLYGKGDVVVDVSHGCSVLGSERTITKAKGNVIYEIDGKPALQVMAEYLSPEEIKNQNLSMVSLCLGFKAPQELAEYQGDEYIIRVIPKKDDAEGSISIYTEVESGTKVWMTRRDPEKMMNGVNRLTKRLAKTLDGKAPRAILQFECMGRGKNMFREEDKMALLDRLQTTIGTTIPWIGVYCYGEIAPVGKDNYFHNYTSVVAAIT